MSEIDDLLGSAVAAGRAPALVAMAATRDGLLYEGAFGRLAQPDGPDAVMDSVFWIASMTKPVTAVAAMQLVEQRRLSLDQPAGDIVPALAKPMLLEGFDAAGEPMLRPALGIITLRHLLTHTAGFGADFNPLLGRYVALRGLPAVQTGRLIGLDTPLTFEPGTAWQYGSSIDWVGRIVEAVSGQTLDAYFRDHIFGPLDMRDTAHRIRPELRPRIVRMHERNERGVLRPIEFETEQTTEFWPGGSGLYSTAPDYLRFVTALLHGGSPDGRAILRPETVRLMLQNHIGDVAGPDVGVIGAFDHFPGMNKAWGLSFLINTWDVPGRRSAGSACWVGGGNTHFWLDPNRGVAGVLMTQMRPHINADMLALLEAFESAVYRIC